MDHHLRNAVCAGLVLSAATVLTTAAGRWNAQTGEGSTLLEPGKAVEREISGRRTDLYHVTLTEGQYASVVIEQQGIALVVRVIGANGDVAIESESVGGEQHEALELVAPAAAAYQIQLQPRYPKAPAGQYLIHIGELRPGSERDRLLSEARSQQWRSTKHFLLGAYDKAHGPAESARQIREGVFGADHSEVAASLKLLGTIATARADYAGASALYTRALAINEETSGSDHTSVAGVLDNISENHRLIGNFAEAERAAQRGLDIREKRLGADHFLVAKSFGLLTDVYLERGDASKSETSSNRALDIARGAYGPDDLPFTDFMNRAARVQLLRGNYSGAEQTVSESLLIRERLAGKESFSASDALSLLGLVYYMKGDDLKSEQTYLQSLALKERILGRDHLQIANILNTLGLISFRRRDFKAAEELHRRSLEIKEKTVGSGHLLVASSLNNLGLVYWRREDYPKAKEYFLRTLELIEKWYGPEGIQLAPSLGNLGIISKETGDYDRAEAYYTRQLSVLEKAHGKDHPELIIAVESLGILHRDRGDYVRAEPLFLRALALTERWLGSQHSSAPRRLANLAHLYAASGRVAQALASLQRMTAIEESTLPLNLAAGTERQKLAYFDPFTTTLEKIVSFHVDQDPLNGGARDLAVTTLLQRKARVLDAMADNFATLRSRSSADDRARIDQLNDVTSRLAALVLGGPQRLSRSEHQQRITSLTEQREQLEAEVARRSAGYFEPTHVVTLDAIKAAIPPDAALVEFLVSRPYHPKEALESTARYGESRYIAYVISAGRDVRWKDLGRASDVDAAVGAMREAIRDPDDGNVKRAARALDEKIMQPIRALAGDAKRLLVSSDGQLALIPFEALVDENGRYLVERYSVSYLSAGRDLMRMQTARASKTPPVIVADPLFGEPATMNGASARPREQVSTGNARRSVTAAADLSEMYFAPIAGTAQEARTIQALFPGVEVLTAGRATEQAIKRVEAPQILHIATHGFFLQAPPAAAPKSTPETRVVGTRGIQSSARIDNPLLRSGLALSGANLNKGGTDDGILTALEAAHLNLWGTKLVTLSACDTGVGVVMQGDGVYGLRRSIFLAGAESLVMSLWPVSDYVTREMMTAYYRGLKRGLGRGEALRQVQLSMLKRKGREHPFYWASFIQAGEWANLEGLR